MELWIGDLQWTNLIRHYWISLWWKVLHGCGVTTLLANLDSADFSIVYSCSSNAPPPFPTPSHEYTTEWHWNPNILLSKTEVVLPWKMIKYSMDHVGDTCCMYNPSTVKVFSSRNVCILNMTESWISKAIAVEATFRRNGGVWYSSAAKWNPANVWISLWGGVATNIYWEEIRHHMTTYDCKCEQTMESYASVK